MQGIGVINGSLENAATVRPGSTVGVLTLNGAYTQKSSGILEIEIGGLNVGTEYDRLAVTGNVSFDGTLNVYLIDPFQPSSGNMFDIITYTGTRSGVFSTVNVPSLSGGLMWNLSYDPVVRLTVQ